MINTTLRFISDSIAVPSNEFNILVIGTSVIGRDEQACLMEEVLPVIRERAAALGVDFGGVEVMSAGNGQDHAARNALNSILDTRTLVVGLVSESPWPTVEAGTHVDLEAIELLDAALGNPSGHDRLFVLVKLPPGNDGGNGEHDVELNEQHMRLLERIAHGTYTVRRYRTREEFAEVAIAELAAGLTRLYPPLNDEQWLARERRTHEAFAEQRCRFHAERPSYLEELDAHAQNADPPLIVTGAPGSGKSALLAYWARRYRTENPGAHLVAHYSDASPFAGEPATLMRRIALELHERYEIPIPIPVDATGIAGMLHAVPAMTGSERLMLVLDGVDDGAGDSPAPQWLLDSGGAPMRVIITTNDAGLIDGARARRWPVLSVRPLSSGERKRVLDTLLSSPGILRHREAGTPTTPLFLRTVIEAHTDAVALPEEMNEILSAGSLDQLMERVLARTEEQHGADVVQTVLSLIWASRRGLAESELAGLTRMTPERIATLLGAVAPYMRRRGDLFAFFHERIRETVAVRYVPSAGLARKLHRRLAQYFSRQPVTARRAEEEPWQLLHARAWAELRRCVTDKEMFLELAAKDIGSDLRVYWTHLAERVDMEASILLLHDAIMQHEHAVESGALQVLEALGAPAPDDGDREHLPSGQ